VLRRRLEGELKRQAELLFDGRMHTSRSGRVTKR
jgi:hypothetical protein